MDSNMIEEFRNFLLKNENDQFRLLEKLVLQPSFSGNKQEVDKLGVIISQELSSLPMSLETVEQCKTGNHLLFRSPACSRHKNSILLVGHMDTVFPPESGFDWYREEGKKVFGPGVIDMKGGLVTAIFALKALQHQDLLKKIPITLICNSDEEIGSPTSIELITEQAKKGLFGLVFECGGLDGEIVTGRKGKTGLTLDVSGKGGHAAFAGSDKPSAVLELAHKIIAIEQLNDPERQLAVNVGTIEGGIGPNTIPEKAVAKIDTRYRTQSDGDIVASSLRAIAKKCVVPGTTGVLTHTSFRPPMEQSMNNLILFQHIKDIADRLKITAKAEIRSGVSDANIMAAAGLPVVDGMGPIGDCDHSDCEYMIRESLPLKTLLSTVAIADGWHRINRRTFFP